MIAYSIYRWQHAADSLSFLFLAEWLTGDITNLIGCLLSNTTKTQLYTAAYFCVIDTAMVAQWLHYNRLNKRLARERAGASLNSMLFPIIAVAAPSAIMGLGLLYGPYSDDSLDFSTQYGDGYTHHRRVLLSKDLDLPDQKAVVGYVLGCICGLLYFTSRIPQIVQNVHQPCLLSSVRITRRTLIPFS